MKLQNFDFAYVMSVSHMYITFQTCFFQIFLLILKLVSTIFYQIFIFK